MIGLLSQALQKTEDIARLQRKRVTHKHMGKESGERNVNGGLQVQLEEDGGGSIDRAGMLDGVERSVAYAAL